MSWRSLLALSGVTGCVLVCAAQEPTLEESSLEEPSLEAPSLEELLGDNFGRRQVEQMLEDRPDMQGVIPPTHPLAVWLEKAYAGRQINRRVYWNADVVDRVFDAEHSPPSPGSLPYVWVTDRATVSGIDKWASVIFEMHNIRHTAAFARLFDAAYAEELTADQYAAECLKLEIKAIRATHELFKLHPLPKASLGIDPWYRWVMDPEEVAALERLETTAELQNYFPESFRHYRDYITESVPTLLPWLFSTSGSQAE